MPRSDRPLLALTLRHPWAFAVAHLGKDVENRTWRPGKLQLVKGEDYLAIHGALAPTGKAREVAIAHARELAGRFRPEVAELFDDDALLAEGIVAVARFAGTVEESDSPWFHGPVGWALEKIWALPAPVPCRGAQDLWRCPDDVRDAIRAQWRDAVAAEREFAYEEASPR